MALIQRSLVVLSLGLTGLSSMPALAWHDDGHRIVGEIAERRLSEPARRRVLELLADLPEYATLATAATWADQQAKLDPAFAFAFSSHYVNLDRRASPSELLELCLASSGCVATGVSYYAEVLRSTRATHRERAEALRFLAHFVGDAHQPLHAGHRDDRGGNDVDRLRLLEYTPGPERTNLHAVWDGGLIAITMTRAGLDWRGYAAELDSSIDADELARWGRGSVYDWLEESRLLALGDCYLGADGITPIRAGDTLDEAYLRNSAAIAEMRLQQGGIRLALVLEEIFGDPAPDPTAGTPAATAGTPA